MLSPDLNRCHRCLVTGATGFIGGPLCEFLKNQGLFVRAALRSHAELRSEIVTPEVVTPEVVIPAKAGIQSNKTTSWDESTYCDLTKLDLLRNTEMMNTIDTVFHLAGIAHASSSSNISKELYHKVNVIATEQLMHLAHQAGVKRFIYFSSVKAENPDEKDFYGQSKKAAEKSVLALGKKFKMHVSVLRPALVYGPHVKGNLAMMIRGIQEGWFPRLPETGNKRSLVSLEDLLEVSLNVAEKPEASGKIYIITDGQSYSSKQLYDAIRKALGKSPCRWTLPYIFFQIAAFMGDILQNLCKRTLPFNSEMLDKLLGSAEYSNHEIKRDLAWSPKINFFQYVSRICV